MYESPVRNFDPNHARVLVVGPMAAGKTTLVHSLCHGRTGSGVAAVRPPPTVGCNVDVKLLAGGHADRSVEFWDVGGNPDAALARGMFFEGSEAAGVLLVYDVSNPRSLRELRAWAGELVSAGIQITPDCGSNNMGAGRGGAGVDEVLLDGGTTLHRRELHDGLEVLADLEGGSGGAATATAVRGRVPLLVVGTKEDMGEGFRRAGAALASDLGAGHVAVCAKKLGDEEQFDRFFGEVFRHHSGQDAPSNGGGGVLEWGAEGQEGQDTYFPPTTAGVNNTDRSYASRDHPSASWGGESPGNTAQQQALVGSTVNGSWRRAGNASIREVDGIRGSSSGSSGSGAAAGVESAGAGLVWPVHRGVSPGAAAAAAAGVQRSREKQS